MNIDWAKQNVIATTDGRKIILEFRDDKGNLYEFRLCNSNAKWLSKALKEAVKMRNV